MSVSEHIEDTRIPENCAVDESIDRGRSAVVADVIMGGGGGGDRNLHAQQFIAAVLLYICIRCEGCS